MVSKLEWLGAVTPRATESKRIRSRLCDLISTLSFKPPNNDDCDDDEESFLTKPNFDSNKMRFWTLKVELGQLWG